MSFCFVKRGKARPIGLNSMTFKSFDDRDIDCATEIIKQSLTGELTSEKFRSMLGAGN